MKKWLLILVVMVLPKSQPMFPGMIVRCDEEGKCHWECEFGVVTSTTMVNTNLVVKPSGCAGKPDAPIIINSNSFPRFGIIYD